MAIRNLMEDIVSAVVDEVLLKEAKDDRETMTYKQDIITYVLNRVPPKYFTSERGILHGKLESQFTFQQRTDILFLAHEALEITKKRRIPEKHTENDRIDVKTNFLPHIIGEILEETTFSIIPDVEVTLLYNDQPAQMIDSSWKNPYITNKATKGYYHFWPEFIDDKMSKNNKILFHLAFKHSKFNEKTIELTTNYMDAYNLYKSQIIPIVLFEKKEGVDITFLYE
ncbi:MAG: late competence development ComFB family protein [Spirochaetota bacterium]|nr:late competence development ComFB family protein [Spirochaetota bacterium]